MIGMVHNNPGEMPTLVGRMPLVPGLPASSAPGYTLQGASGVQIQGPPSWERAASYGTFWDRVRAKRYEIPANGLGSPIAHGMGLGNLGLTDDDLTKMAAAMAAKGDSLTTGDIAEAMKLLTGAERDALGAKLIAAGVSTTQVSAAKMMAKASEHKTAFGFWGVLSTVSMAASIYHGYKRNDSIGWALWWGLMGAMFPVITPVVGIAQGFAQPK